ncbi:MAG: GIY-YIG nuclease family protein [Henriciella sp.]|nr:GIY-YIG nuclease family protein [Henriciella sp.]
MPSREFILSEIQRVYEKYDRAPGMRVFERETGIRKPEWYGVHWRSWSAALVEAGLEPNKKQGKLSSDNILQQYAEFVRQLGRIPAEVDVRMYARDNEGFPSHTTFSKHFGNKASLLQALSAWVAENEEFADIANLLPDEEDTKATQESAREGFVYLLKSGAHFKIGRSDEIERRVKEIGVSMPEKVDLVHTIRTDDPSGIESYWHRRFSDKRANGEWFKLTREDIRAFKRRKFQ